MASRHEVSWPGQRIIHVGSALEYGNAGGDLRENSHCDPTTIYGRSKLAGTQSLSRSCKELGISGVTARLFTVYGPGEEGSRLLPTLIASIAEDQPIELTDGLHTRDFTYVEDVAEALLRLGLAGAVPGEVVNVATGKLTRVREFVSTAASILGLPERRLAFGALPTRPEEMKHEAVNIQRLKELTGWAPPTGIGEGVRKTLLFARTKVDASTATAS
jgi:nucleoside-diphosphate-sugar epimerase